MGRCDGRSDSGREALDCAGHYLGNIHLQQELSSLQMEMMRPEAHCLLDVHHHALGDTAEDVPPSIYPLRDVFHGIAAGGTESEAC